MIHLSGKQPFLLLTMMFTFFKLLITHFSIFVFIALGLPLRSLFAANSTGRGEVRNTVSGRCIKQLGDLAIQQRQSEVMQRWQLTPETMFYRSLPPEYLRKEADGSITIGANPFSNTSIWDVYGGDPEKLVRAKGLEEKGLAFSLGDGLYGSKNDVVVNFPLREALARGARLYESDQGNFYLTLPSRIPISVVRGEPRRVKLGTHLERTMRRWDGDTTRVYEFSNDDDPSFKLYCQQLVKGSEELKMFSARFQVANATLQILRFEPTTLTPNDPRVESMVLSYLINHPETTRIQFIDDPSIDINEWLSSVP